MPTVLPMTRVEAYLAFKAGVISESALKPSLKTNYYSGLEHWLAYWCGLTADYPKDENNDPKWYTEEEYYVAYLCGIAPDYPVNCYRRVGAYLRYIISARWEKPEKPLTREEYYLSLMSTTYLPANDPASDISIDNTAEAPFGDLKIYGDCFQQNYTGKNKMNATTPFSTSSGFDYSGDNQLIYANGTRSSAGSVNWSNFSLKAGTYILMLELVSGTITSTSTGGLFYVYGDNITGNTRATNIKTDNPKVYQTITVTADTTNAHLNTWARATETYTNAVIKYQLIEGSTEDYNFEPYVGGVPAPNPDYPQDINVVAGEQAVKVVGKNLANYNTSGTNNFNIGDIKAGKTYTISFDFLGNIPSGAINLKYGNGGATITALYNPSQGHKKVTFTASQDAVVFYNAYGTGSGAGAENIMLELGSKETDYQPYQSQTYEIDLASKNLYNPAADTVGYYLDSSGALVSQGSWHVSEYVRVQPGGTYTYSGLTFTPNAPKFCFYDKDHNFLSSIVRYGEGATITVPASAHYIRFSIYKYVPGTGTVTVADETLTFQFEAGSTATAYAPYFAPIELCKIGDYQDYIWTDGEKWYKYSAIGKDIYDGSADESWSRFATTSTQNGGFFINRPGSISGSPCLSNKFINQNTLSPWQGGVGTFRISSSLNAIFETTPIGETVPNLSDWTTSLASSNLILYYPLATASDTEITDAALVAQLDALLEGGSYDNQTNIVVSAADPNLPGLLQVTAAKWQ